MGENQVRVYFLCAPVVFNLVQFFLLGKRLNVKPVTARQPMKLARTEARERRRTEIDEKRKKQHELEVLQKAKEEKVFMRMVLFPKLIQPRETKKQ